MSIVVRSPRTSDVGRLAVVNVETWRHAYAGLIVKQRLDAMELGEYRDRWRGNVTDSSDDHIFLVAEVDAEIAAYAIGGPYRPQETDETPDTARLGELYALYTHPTMQGLGAGRAMHAELLVRLAGEGYADAALWVLRDNMLSGLGTSGRAGARTGQRRTGSPMTSPTQRCGCVGVHPPQPIDASIGTGDRDAAPLV